MGSRSERSLKAVVGGKTYEVWTDMVRRLVPEGRTHRLAPLIAGMLQHAALIACERHDNEPEEGSAAHSLLASEDAEDPRELEELLGDLVEQLFEDADVGHERVSSRGEHYSVAEQALYEFIHWYDMPWEA